MQTPLIKRFSQWLGTWRGPAEFADGQRGMMQMTLEALFNGDVIEVVGTSFDQEGDSILRGMGYLSLGRDGRAVQNIYYSLVGFALLHEVPDDQGVLAMQGPLPGNLHIDIAFSGDRNSLSLSSRVGEGYTGKPGQPRTFTRMQRIGGVARRREGFK